MGAHDRLRFRARTRQYGVVPAPQVLTFWRHIEFSPFAEIDRAQGRRIGNGVAIACDETLLAS